jgi:hypothetical protein
VVVVLVGWSVSLGFSQQREQTNRRIDLEEREGKREGREEDASGIVMETEP